MEQKNGYVPDDALTVAGIKMDITDQTNTNKVLKRREKTTDIATANLICIGRSLYRHGREVGFDLAKTIFKLVLLMTGHGNLEAYLPTLCLIVDEEGKTQSTLCIPVRWAEEESLGKGK